MNPPAHVNAPAVSIVMPVYNTRPWLPATLDCVLAQDLQDWECVCIDDGSTDGSAELVREYAARDSRVRLLTQKNAGAAAARNRGIDEARGHFLVFVDADDIIEPDMLSSCVERLRDDQSELCVYEMDSFDSASGKKNPANMRVPIAVGETHAVFSVRQRQENLLISISASPCNKMYDVQWLRRRGLRFPDTLKRSEDTPFAAWCLAEANRISCIRRALYHYRLNRPGSQMRTLSDKSVRYCYVEAAEEIWRGLRERGLLKEFGLGALRLGIGNSHYYLSSIDSVFLIGGANRLGRWGIKALRELRQTGAQLSPEQIWGIRKSLCVFIYICYKKYFMKLLRLN